MTSYQKTPTADIGNFGNDHNQKQSTSSSTTLQDSHLALSMEEAVNRLGMGRFQYRIFVAAGLCFAADAMEVFLLSFLSTILQVRWNLTDAQTALMTSSVFLGSLVGTLVFGRLGDEWGRRPTFLLAAAIIAVFGLLSAFTINYATLVVTRVIVGCGIGGLTIPYDTLAEFLPTPYRGKFTLSLNYFWTLGTLLVVGSAYVSLQYLGDDWRLLVAFCSVPCFISTIIGFIYVPESPRWLITMGRMDQAVMVLRQAATENGMDEGRAMELFPEGMKVLDVAEGHASSSIFELFRNPKLRSTVFFLSIVWGGFGLLYYAAVFVITIIFAKPDADEDTIDFDYNAIFVSSTAEFVGLTMVLITVDTWGRVLSQMYSYFLGGLCIWLLCFGHDQNWSSKILVTVAFGARLFFMSGSCATWTCTPELLPTELRTTGHSLVNAVARVTGALSPFVVQGGASNTVVGSILGVVGLATTLAVWRLPETKGVEIGALNTTTQGEVQLQQQQGFRREVL